MNDNKKLLVTSPLMPTLEDLNVYLKDIWESKWLTNAGKHHEKLENELAQYLGVEHLSLFSNGTLALITALQALRASGEVITTPYSFVATTHSLWWNGIRPVFADIDPITMNLCPELVEAAITPKTTAIMPVHVYGYPCDNTALQEIADKYGLRLIYDAAHAFGVQKNGESILNWGDMSILSFHATKTYSTIEGGAIICKDAKTKQRIDYLKNFGFAGETEVVGPGINAKLNEVQSAYGLATLKIVDSAIKKRKDLTTLYLDKLASIQGINAHYIDNKEITQNYSYFPILVDENYIGKTRDALYDHLKSFNIFGRRYFYPLISSFSTYRGLPSASINNLPNANKIAKQIICLPMHHELEEVDVEFICKTIIEWVK